VKGAAAPIRLSRRRELFLRSEDACRFATVDSRGCPHCVPVSYVYRDGIIYIATVSTTKKVRNVAQNPNCCIVVDVGGHGRGRGLMLQGRAKLVKGTGYPTLKRIIETLTGWHLEDWRIDGSQPDSALVFTPYAVVEIGGYETLC
jgi:nitroimidazol reductase NimA-like FMN-containing flavoprotein (pyridoxamine 5'-phosphate oxidase superfamily)